MNTKDNEVEQNPSPDGELVLQTLTLPKDTNAHGDIYGGWLVCQMDLAAATLASRIAEGRTATVAIESMAFIRPVKVGSVINCYATVLSTGRSSVTIQIEVWIKPENSFDLLKVTEGSFVFVAIDQNGRTRPIPEERK